MNDRHTTLARSQRVRGSSLQPRPTLPPTLLYFRQGRRRVLLAGRSGSPQKLRHFQTCQAQDMKIRETQPTQCMNTRPKRSLETRRAWRNSWAGKQRFPLPPAKIVKQQCLLQMSPQYGELRPTNGWDRLASLRHRSKFQWVSRLGIVNVPTSLTGGQPNLARCLAVSWAGTLYTVSQKSSHVLTVCNFVKS